MPRATGLEPDYDSEVNTGTTRIYNVMYYFGARANFIKFAWIGHALLLQYSSRVSDA